MATLTTGLKDPKVVSHNEWVAARKQHLAKEKEFTRLRDELSRQRRELPWERDRGRTMCLKDLAAWSRFGDLFDKRGQLVIYHFMFWAGMERRLSELLVSFRSLRWHDDSPGAP